MSAVLDPKRRAARATIVPRSAVIGLSCVVTGSMVVSAMIPPIRTSPAFTRHLAARAAACQGKLTLDMATATGRMLCSRTEVTGLPLREIHLLAGDAPGTAGAHPAAVLADRPAEFQRPELAARHRRHTAQGLKGEHDDQHRPGSLGVRGPQVEH